jgi:gliding motility-associated-like protein
LNFIKNDNANHPAEPEKCSAISNLFLNFGVRKFNLLNDWCMRKAFLLFISIVGFAMPTIAQTDVPGFLNLTVNSNDNTVSIQYTLPSNTLDLTAIEVHQPVDPNDTTTSGPGSTMIYSFSDFTNSIIRIPGTDASGSAQYYRLRAVYTGNPSVPFTSYHKTIWLSGIQEQCDLVNLQWNAYIGWPQGISNYIVLRRIDSGNSQLLSKPNTTNFSERVSSDGAYVYQVYAVSSDSYYSYSNPISLDVVIANPPTYITASYPVVNGNNIQIHFKIDPSSEQTIYKVLRKSVNETSYVVLDSLNVTDKEIDWVDSTADIYQVYYYKMEAYNNCGVLSCTSNEVHNTVLSITTDNTTTQLKWTETSDATQYTIFRSVSNGAYEELLSTQNNLATDNAGEVLEPGMNGNFCYYIQPEGNYGNGRSNVFCITLSSVIKMPNAFTPNGDGKNDEFKPALQFTPIDYYFVVYDRWGGIVFETSSVNEGWNGYYDRNKKVDAGTYMYMFRYKLIDGRTVQQKGYVTVVIPSY